MADPLQLQTRPLTLAQRLSRFAELLSLSAQGLGRLSFFVPSVVAAGLICRLQNVAKDMFSHGVGVSFDRFLTEN